MIPLCLKYTPKVDVETPMLAYLNTRYGKEESAKHAHTINDFQALRNEVAAIQAPNEGARAVLIKYFVQSGYAKDRFPVSETGVKINFTWSDSLKPGKAVSQFSWSFERASVLFNIAACCSFVGAGANRSDAAGIKVAASNFAAAAGILLHLRDSLAPQIIGGVTYDLTAPGLDFLINLMLAQGQACYYEMARLQKMKVDMCSKVAAQCADFYRASFNALPPAMAEDMDRSFPWSLYTRYWAACFDASAFMAYAAKTKAEALACGTGYGNEIAWLKLASNAAGTALNIVRSSKHKMASSVNTEAATQLQQTADIDHARAVKDNNSIYMNVVPKFETLPMLPRAALSVPTPPPDYAAGSSDMFIAISPVELIKSMSALDAKLDAAVEAARGELNAASEAARKELASMGLPGYLDANDATSGVPAAVWERIQKTQIEGGIRELDRLWDANSGIAEGTRTVLRQVAATLDDEATSDAAFRAQYGDKWTAAPSELLAADLRGDLAKYTKVSEVAQASSDGQVRAKLDANRQRITMLSKPRAELDATVPSAYIPGGSGGSERPADVVRAQLKSEVQALQTNLDSRPSLATDIKSRFNREPAMKALSAAPPEQHEAVIDQLLSASTAPRAAITASLTAQDASLERIRTLHARFADVRAQDERTRAREAAIQELCEAVDRFEELRSNLREGGEFYRTLKGHADVLLGNARDMAAARTMQAREMQLNIKQASINQASATSGDAGLAARIGGMDLGAAAPPSGPTAYPAPPSGSLGAIAVPLTREVSASAYPGMSTVSPSNYNPFDHFPSTAPPPPGPAAPAPGGGGWGGGGAAPARAALPPQQQQSYPSYAQAGGGGGPGGGGGWGAPQVPSGPTHAPPPSRGPQPQPQAVPSGPMPPQLVQLVGMGFDAAKADAALRSTNGDVGLAIAQLLSHP